MNIKNTVYLVALRIVWGYLGRRATVVFNQVWVRKNAKYTFFYRMSYLACTFSVSPFIPLQYIFLWFFLSYIQFTTTTPLHPVMYSRTTGDV